MSEVKHVLKKSGKRDILKAHFQLAGKIVNPKEYIDLGLRYKAGKGFVYSDQHRYLGPGNDLPLKLSEVDPHTRGDMLAYWHDRSYHDFENRTGKKPYMYYHKSDDDLINKTRYDQPDELAAKYIFGAKRKLYEAGLLEHADDVLNI